ncbi:HNH endonuclease, partial [Bacillus cereus]|uniref:HNH endonuclease n=1 Tax=Bacillus cereus TaxID=1396 RepID=UPI003D178CE7
DEPVEEHLTYEEDGQEVEEETVVGEGIFQPIEAPSEVFLQPSSENVSSGIVSNPDTQEPSIPKVVLEKTMDTSEIEDRNSGETLSLLSGTSETLSEMGIEKENYTLTYVNNVKLTKIAISEPVKKGRASTIVGLTKSVGELGVVTPIHLMKLETADEDDDSDMPCYQMIDGLRRVYSSVKNNLETIPAMIWDFRDKQKGRQAALILGLTLNRHQKRTWSEIWDLYNILEKQSQIKPNTFESLFQLEGGDAMKLKDVMFSGYQELVEELLADIKTLDQAYKQLQKLRKEENTLEIEDQTGFAESSDMAKDVVEGEEKPDVQLSNEEVLDILEMGESMGKGVGSDDFSEMDGMFKEEEPYQTSKDRKPLDPVLRQKILARDEYSCMCCSTHGPAFVGCLVVHHIIPVHCFGSNPTSNPDAENNLVTLCDACHLIVHIVERNSKLPLTEEQFNSYEYNEQLRIKNILHYGRIAILAGKQKGMTDEQRKKLAKTRHRMPGEGFRENAEGYEAYQKQLEEIESIKQEDKATS